MTNTFTLTVTYDGSVTEETVQIWEDVIRNSEGVVSVEGNLA